MPATLRHYYNEIDPFAARWLEALIAAGELPAGDVDRRSIWDVEPSDLAGYRQCHFFAGIGGWPLACRLAGIPPDVPLWTGSCPCQPFSEAGRGVGFADERHLWPAFYHLIGECGPARVCGEQVASRLAWPWIDLVQADLEAAAYAVWAVVLPAASVGAPHGRHRVWWVGDLALADGGCLAWTAPRVHGGDGESGDVAARRGTVGRASSGVGDAAEGRRRPLGTPRPESRGGRPADAGTVGDAGGAGLPPRERPPLVGARRGDEGGAAGKPGRPPNAAASFWEPCDWLPCRDGKRRPVEPGTFPLAHGVPGRVGTLRGYGNAIVPHVGAVVLRAAWPGICS